MTTTYSKQYGTVITPAITSWNSLASDTTVGYLVGSSAAVANTSSTPAIGYEISVTVSYTNSSPTVAYVYLYIASYNGSTWSDDGYGDSADGTDQTITIGDPTSLRFLGALPILQNKVTTAGQFWLWDPPVQFCVVLHNGSGQGLSPSGHGLRVTPLNYISA